MLCLRAHGGTTALKVCFRDASPMSSSQCLGPEARRCQTYLSQPQRPPALVSVCSSPHPHGVGTCLQQDSRAVVPTCSLPRLHYPQRSLLPPLLRAPLQPFTAPPTAPQTTLEQAAAAVTAGLVRAPARHLLLCLTGSCASSRPTAQGLGWPPLGYRTGEAPVRCQCSRTTPYFCTASIRPWTHSKRNWPPPAEGRGGAGCPHGCTNPSAHPSVWGGGGCAPQCYAVQGTIRDTGWRGEGSGGSGFRPNRFGGADRQQWQAMKRQSVGN